MFSFVLLMEVGSVAVKSLSEEFCVIYTFTVCSNFTVPPLLSVVSAALQIVDSLIFYLGYGWMDGWHLDLHVNYLCIV